MTPLRSTADAVAHLYRYRGDKAALATEVDRLIKSGELQLDKTELQELCTFWSIAPAGLQKYGEGSSNVSSSGLGGGEAAGKLKAASFDAPPSMAWSDFAIGRHKPGTGYAYFNGTQQELLDLVKTHWKERVPGRGRTNLDEVVIVKLPADKFMTTTIEVGADTELKADFYRRRASEKPYVRVTAKGEAEPAQFASVVLYNKETLGKNNERSTKADWEVVSIIAGPVENEPMDPYTMARNMLGMAGGSQVNYSAEDFARAVVYWAEHSKVL